MRAWRAWSRRGLLLGSASGALVGACATPASTSRPVGARWSLPGHGNLTLLGWTPYGILLRADAVELRGSVAGELLWSTQAGIYVQVAVDADLRRLAIFDDGSDTGARIAEVVDLETGEVHRCGEAAHFDDFQRLDGWAGRSLVLGGHRMEPRVVGVDEPCGPVTCREPELPAVGGRYLAPDRRSALGRVRISPDGTRVAQLWQRSGQSSGRYLKVRAIAEATGREVDVDGDHVLWSPDGEVLVVWGGPTIGFWSAESLELLAEVPAGRSLRGFGLGWSPDGRRLCLWGGRTAEILDLPRTARCGAGPATGERVFFSPAGDLLVCGEESSFRIADGFTGERLVLAAQAQRW